MKNRIYFDHAATTPVDKEVIDLISKTLAEQFGNPSSIYAEGRTSRTIVEDARKTIAQGLGASIGDIFFTSCGSESNNMILKGAIHDLGVKRIITSPIEHHCVLHTVQKLDDLEDVEVTHVKLDEKGTVDYSHLEELLQDTAKKTLVSLMHSNNEIGTMINLDKVADLCKESNALFHSDTVQTIGYFNIDVEKTPIHFLAGSAHKFNGPKGVGFVYINGDFQISPLIDGGGQERKMRAGTENVPYIAGMALAFKKAYAHLKERKARIEELRNYLISTLNNNFTDLAYYGDYLGEFHYKVLSVSFPPSPKSELLLLNLDINGICVSGGSACTSGAEVGSHVLEGLKLPEDRKTIRFSFSHSNTEEEIDYVVKILKETLLTKQK